MLLLAEREQDRAFEVSPAMAVGHGEATEENRKNRHEAMDERLGGCSSILGEMHALTPNRVRFRLTGGEATVREVWGRASARKLHLRVLDLQGERLNT